MSQARTSQRSQPSHAFRKVRYARDAMDTALKSVSTWLNERPDGKDANKETCARMILCGTADKRINVTVCGAAPVAEKWRVLNKPCVKPSSVNDGTKEYDSMFSLWLDWHNTVNKVNIDMPELAKYKLKEVDKRKYWTPVKDSGLVFKSNPFVALYQDNTPLIWNDVWFQNGEQYLKANYQELLQPAVPLVLSEGNAIPFAQIGNLQKEGSRRLTHGSKGRVRSNPKAWGLTENGARRRQDMLDAQMELTNWVQRPDSGCGFSRVIVISPGYKQNGNEESSQWWKVTSDGRKFRKEKTFENSAQLTQFAEKQKKLGVGVAVWMPSKIVEGSNFKAVKRSRSNFKFDKTYKSTIRLYCPQLGSRSEE